MIIKQYITDFLWECTAFFGVLQVVLNYKDVKVPKRLTGIAAMLTIDSSKEQTQSYSIPRQKISWPIHFPQFRHAASKPTPVDASTGLMPQFPLRVCLRKLLCLMIFVSSFLPFKGILPKISSSVAMLVILCFQVINMEGFEI